MPRWWPWKRGVDYETALPQLTAQLRESQIELARAHGRERRAKGLLALYGLIAYAGLLLALFFSNATSAIWITILLGAGSLIWLVRWLVLRVLEYFTSRRHKITLQLLERRRIMAEEYKQKTNFYKVKELTELNDSEKPEISPSPRKLSQDTLSKAQQSKTLDPNTSRNRTGKKELDAHAPSKPKMPQGVEAVSTEHKESTRKAPRETFTPSQSPQRGWMDRILDILIGEDETSPQNRYALICKTCNSHNGLAAFGEQPENVVYRCPSCGSMNGKRDAADLLSANASSLPASQVPTDDALKPEDAAGPKT